MGKIAVPFKENDGTEGTREVYALNREGGLVVTEGLGEFGLWLVTHERTGRTVCRLTWLFAYDARLFMRALLPLADWTRSFEELRTVEGLGARILAEGRKVQESRDLDMPPSGWNDLTLDGL